MSKQFTLVKIKAQPELRLQMEFADGESFMLNLAPIIKRHKSLAPLADPKMLSKPKITDDGATVTWAGDDALQLAADNMRARAIEQAGGVSHEFIWNWMHMHGLSLVGAAAALGISRRMLAYYRSGEKPVPLTVGLACLGWNVAHDPTQHAANHGTFALAV